MKEIIAKGRGKTFCRSVDAARKRVKDGETHLIRRHGAWFRPDALGYCSEIAGAGVFSADAARSYLGVEGLSVVPLKSVQKMITAKLAELEHRAAKLRMLKDGAQ